MANNNQDPVYPRKLEPDELSITFPDSGELVSTDEIKGVDGPEREFSGVGGLDVGQRADVISKDFESVGPVEERGSRLKDVFDTFRRTQPEGEAYRSTTEYFLQDAHNTNSAIPNNLEGMLNGEYPDFFIKGKPPTLEQILQKLTNFEDPSFTELAAEKIPQALLTAAGTSAVIAGGAAIAPIVGPALATTAIIGGTVGTMFAADAASDWLSGIGLTPRQTEVLNPTRNYLDAGLDSFFENLSVGLPITGAIKSRLSGVDYSLVEKQVSSNKIKQRADDLFRKGASFLGRGVEDYGPKTLAAIEAALSTSTGIFRGLAEGDEPGVASTALLYELGAGFTPVVSIPKMIISITKYGSVAADLGRTRAGQLVVQLSEQYKQDPEGLRKALLAASDPEFFRTLPGGDQVPLSPNRSVVESSAPEGVDEFGEPFTGSQAIEVLVQNLRVMNKEFDNLFVQASDEERKELTGLMNQVVSTWSKGAPEGATNVFIETHNMRFGALVSKYQDDITEILEKNAEATQRISGPQRLNPDGTPNEAASSQTRKEGSVILVEQLEEGLNAARALEKSLYEGISSNETVTPTALLRTLIEIRDGKFKGLRTKGAKSERSLDQDDEDLLNETLFDFEDFMQDPTVKPGTQSKKINVMAAAESRKFSDEMLLENIKDAPFEVLMNLRSVFLSKSRSKAANVGDDVLASVYGQLARAIDEDITGRARAELSRQNETGIVTENGQKIIAAWENSKALNDTWTRSFAGSLMKVNKKGGAAIPPELALYRLAAGSADASNLRVSQVRAAARTIGLELNEAGLPLGEVANVKAAEDRGLAVDDQIGVIYRQLAEKLIRKDGSLDLKLKEKFFDDYAALFEEVPDLQRLRDSLNNAEEANALLQAFAKSKGKSPSQILALPNKGDEAVGEFVKSIARKELWAAELGVDPKDFFTTLSNSKDPAKTFREVADWSASQGDEVAEGFKEIVLDRAFAELDVYNKAGDLDGNIFSFSKILLGPMFGIKNQPSYLKVMLDSGLVDTEYVVNFKKLVRALETQARMAKKPAFEKGMLKESEAFITEEAAKKSRLSGIGEALRGAYAGILGSETLSSLASAVGLTTRGLIIPAAGAKIGREVAGSGGTEAISIPGFSRKFILEALEPGNEVVLARLLDFAKDKGAYKVNAAGEYVPKSKGEQALANAKDRKLVTALNKMIFEFLPRVLTPVTQRAVSTERYLENRGAPEGRLSEEERQRVSAVQGLDSQSTSREYYYQEGERNRREKTEELEKSREKYRNPPPPPPNRVPLSALPTQPNPASSLAQQGATPQQRSQFANMFPNDITSNIINSRNRGGIGSLV